MYVHETHVVFLDHGCKKEKEKRKMEKSYILAGIG